RRSPVLPVQQDALRRGEIAPQLSHRSLGVPCFMHPCQRGTLQRELGEPLRRLSLQRRQRRIDPCLSIRALLPVLHRLQQALQLVGVLRAQRLCRLASLVFGLGSADQRRQPLRHPRHLIGCHFAVG